MRRAGSLSHKTDGASKTLELSTNESRASLELDQWEWRRLVEVDNIMMGGSEALQSTVSQEFYLQLTGHHGLGWAGLFQLAVEERRGEG